MTQLTDKGIFAIEVPSMAYGFMINNYADESELMYMLDIDEISDEPSHDETLIPKKLPPGSYEFLFCTKEASERDVINVVAWIEIAGKIGYYDYMNLEPYRYLYNHTESIESLLRSKNLNHKKNYALIKRLH